MPCILSLDPPKPSTAQREPLRQRACAPQPPLPYGESLKQGLIHPRAKGFHSPLASCSQWFSEPPPGLTGASLEGNWKVLSCTSSAPGRGVLPRKLRPGLTSVLGRGDDTCEGRAMLSKTQDPYSS
jgi:hypothetical protein